MKIYRRKPDAGPDVELPITPMLDMAFQLLAFFVLTYKPPSAIEGQMELMLPPKTEAAAKDPMKIDPNKPSEASEAPVLEADVTVAIRAQSDTDPKKDGSISEMTVQEQSGTTVVPNTEALLPHLKKLREGLDNKKEGIKIQADSRLKWQYVVQVMDVCRKVGFNNISFIQPPDFAP